MLTLNCQGLGDSEKRKDVLNYLKCKQFDIYCLQDTHFTYDSEPYIESQWRYTFLFNSFTSNSRGVTILFNNTFEYKIHRMKFDKSGNFVILDITLNKKKITLINTYGPNIDTPIFFLNILKTIEEFQNDEYI